VRVCQSAAEGEYVGTCVSLNMVVGESIRRIVTDSKGSIVISTFCQVLTNCT
jgi:hypothetical protein